MNLDMSQENPQGNPLATEPYVEPLWTPLALFAPLRARLSGPLPQPVFGISIDTRTLMPGDLFFAIKGEQQRRPRSCRRSFRQRRGGRGRR